MLVYRSDRDPLVPVERAAFLAERLERATRRVGVPHDGIVDFLIDFGVLEAAIADALFPDADGLHPAAERMRRVGAALGAALRHSWRGEHGQVGTPLAEAARTVRALAADQLPEVAWSSVPEGYAWYALHPEGYVEAAERFASDHGPVPVVCLGLRSIGTGLSSAVEAALAARGSSVERHTLRPRGHPFDRRPVVDGALEARLRTPGGRYFLLVDEGPGLSGSSLAGAAALLSRLGVPDARIVLFPGWRTDGASLRSAEARERWRRHAQYVVDGGAVRARMTPLHPAAAGPFQDLSAGRWRRRVLRDPRDWPAAHPQHERLKLLGREPERGAPVLLRFAGLGRYGRGAARLARRLAEEGWTAPTYGIANGFLATAFVAGRPLHAADADAGTLEHLARYVAFRARACPAERGASVDSLREMLRVNVGEGLGEPWAGRLLRTAAFAAAPAGAAAAIDGRMHPHEFLRTPGGLLKCDAVDHHADHFYPGPQDAAWDLAGAAAEWGLDAEGRARLAARYAALTGDADVRHRLPFHSLAYLASRLGYVMLAAESLRGSEDGRRFRFEVRRYAELLRRAIRRAERAEGTARIRA